MRKSCLALSVAALAAHVPNLALSQPGSAVCRAGAGCECANLDDVGLLPVLLGDGALGLDAPQSIVIDRTTNTTFRTERSLNEVHRSFGGRGDCPDIVEPAEILPRDGTWRWRQVAAATTGCPPMMAAMVDSGREETLVQSVAWNGAFHPERFSENLPAPEMGEMSVYEWRRIGRNRWLSDNLKGRECDDGTCVDFALSLSMNVISETEVTGLLTTRSKVNGSDAGMLAMWGMDQCEIRVRYAINHMGP